jgi:glycosyltransferase involved in cell wall biosynthesis
MRTGLSAPRRSGPVQRNDNCAIAARDRVGARRAARPTVAIFMCTYNGERFLAEQIAPLQWQTFTNWRLVASDDGSTDGTLAILRTFRDAYPPGRSRSLTARGPERRRANLRLRGLAVA